MKPLRGIPSSRAYWELKAEQMMNRVFDPQRIIDLDPDPEPHPPSAPPAAASPAGSSRPRPLHKAAASPPVAARRNPGHGASRRQAAAGGRTSTVPAAGQRLDRQLLLIASLGGVCLVSALCSVLFLNHTWKVQENLRQERNLLLVERLRSLGPASAASQPPVAAAAPVQTVAAAAASGDLPPPPDEPWMQQLGALPQGETNQAPVLRVPVSPRLAAAAPAATATAARPARPDPGASAPPPQLVGLVGAQGRQGSAIFQVGSSSTSVSVGESIGSSGWRLQAAEGDTAVIERNGVVRRISMSNGS